jgi:hypothetical protein
MCRALNSIPHTRKKGRKEGRKKGRKEGREERREEGRKGGRKKVPENKAINTWKVVRTGCLGDWYQNEFPQRYLRSNPRN